MRYYSSTFVKTSIVGDITSTQTQFTLSALSGAPASTPWTALIDGGTDIAELVDVTDVSGLVVTVTRGVAGTTAIGHKSGATFDHDTSHRDYQEPQDHIAASAAVHGVTGDVVGTTDTQTLSGKTIDGTANTLQNIPNTALDDLAIAKVTNLQTELDGKMANPSTAFDVGGLLVGTGSNTYDVLNGGNAGDVPIKQANGSVAFGPIAGTLIGVTAYAPSVSSLPDTNNLTLTFTAPASGNVLLRSVIEVKNNSYAQSITLGWRDHGTTTVIGADKNVWQTAGTTGTATTAHLAISEQLITGLTAGQDYTYDLYGSGGTSYQDAVLTAWAA